MPQQAVTEPINQQNKERLAINTTKIAEELYSSLSGWSTFHDEAKAIKIIETAAKNKYLDQLEKDFLDYVDKQENKTNKTIDINKETLLGYVSRKLDVAGTFYSSEVKQLAKIFYPNEDKAIDAAENVSNLLNKYVEQSKNGEAFKAEATLKELKDFLYQYAGASEKTKEIKNPAEFLEMEAIFNTFYASKIEKSNNATKEKGEIKINTIADNSPEEHKLINSIEKSLKNLIHNDEVLLIFGLIDAVHNDSAKINFSTETAVKYLHNCVENNAHHSDAAILVMEIFKQHNGDINELMSAYQKEHMPNSKEENGLAAKKFFARELFQTNYTSNKVSTLSRFLFLLYPENKNLVSFCHSMNYHLIHTDNYFAKDFAKPSFFNTKDRRFIDINMDSKVLNEIYNNYYEPHFIKGYSDTTWTMSPADVAKEVSKMGSEKPLINAFRYRYGEEISGKYFEPTINKPELPKPIKQ